MSRYIQQDYRKTPPKAERPTPITKVGSYTAKDLEAAKKIITPNGGKR